MKVEIEVISTDFIPPSSPTPNDLSNYKFSFLDQLHTPLLLPQPIFYESTGSLTKSETSSRLKTSLSKTLSLYYPLAGRIVGNTHVNCNDEGVMFVEALADCKLLDVINEPIPHELDKLLPQNLDDIRDVCVIVQTTFFECGGLAIGLAFSHKVGDGLSYILFANTWAAISRGDDAHIQSPLFDRTTLFPPGSDLSGFDPTIRKNSKKELITKRFVFTVSKINDLRNKYTNTTRATRVEALTAFIWTRLVVSTQTKKDPEIIFTLCQILNLRNRVVPPMPDYLFGNFIYPAVALVSLRDVEEEVNVGVIEKMRESVRTVGGEDFLTKINDGRHTIDSLNDFEKKNLSGELVNFTFASLCRFPVYEVDFGWGKPVWHGLGTGRNNNAVVFTDLVSGDCIEAWITLKLEDMVKFEVDEELLAYATT